MPGNIPRHIFYQAVGTVYQLCCPSLLTRLRYTADAHINIRNFIPGRIVRYSALGQAEDFLEDAHGVRRFLSVYAIYRNLGDCRVILGNPVKLLLQLSDFISR